eukprot:1408692-Pleurochrysis_carterae.AAC.2
MLLSYLSAPRDYNARASEAASRFSGDSEADVVFREPRVGDRQLLFVSFVVASAGWYAHLLRFHRPLQLCMLILLARLCS